MMTRLKIEVEQNEFFKEVFSFVFLDGYVLYLDGYEYLERETKRHRFRSVKMYDRVKVRNSNISEKEVPLTKEIQDQAIKLFTEKIKVKKWSERE